MRGSLAVVQLSYLHAEETIGTDVARLALEPTAGQGVALSPVHVPGNLRQLPAFQKAQREASNFFELSHVRRSKAQKREGATDPTRNDEYAHMLRRKARVHLNTRPSWPRQ